MNETNETRQMLDQLTNEAPSIALSLSQDGGVTLAETLTAIEGLSTAIKILSSGLNSYRLVNHYKSDDGKPPRN